MTDDNDNGAKLSPKQLQALDLLLAGETITSAAKITGITRETLSRWRHHDADFIAAYNAGMKSIAEAGLMKLLDAKKMGVERLVELAGSKNESIAFKASSKLASMDVKLPDGSVDPETIRNNQVFSEELASIIKEMRSRLFE